MTGRKSGRNFRETNTKEHLNFRKTFKESIIQIIVYFMYKN